MSAAQVLGYYVWASFALSLWLLLKLPSRMSKIDNLIGSAFCAMMGPVLWPVYLAGYLKHRRGAALAAREGGAS